MQPKKSKRTPVVHPFLLATYPILALLAANIEETKLSTGFRPLLISLFTSSLVYIGLRLILRDKYKAGIIASLLIILFFSYGHIYNYIEGKSFSGLIIGRHRWLILIWMGLLAIGIWWVLKKLLDTQTTTKVLNIIAVIALVFPIMQLGLYSFRTINQATLGYASSGEFEYLSPPPNQRLPDIYYIILDGYSRDDILNKYYDLDNSHFLQRLQAMGFYVARCSQSNYAQTQLSLASSLNHDYLENIDARFTSGNKSRLGLTELIQHSTIRKALESFGYKIVAFDSGYEPTRLRDADLYLSPQVVADINDFENLLLRTTFGRVFAEGIAFLNLPPDWETRDQAHRERILFTLAELRQLSELPGPKFVFVHIVSPHWPHVFGPNGEPVHERPDSVSGYRNQVIFINSQIEPILQQLISQSEPAPIIIIQGDHGSIIESPQRRMSILNAYYLPEGGGQSLYENISPVNTFRLILIYYFAGNAPLRADLSYYSRYDDPYNYQLIHNQRNGCTNE